MDPETITSRRSQAPISLATRHTFISRLHEAWRSRWPKWYAKMIPGQQHVIDKLVSLRLEEFEKQLVALDREDSELSHQLAELSTQVTQMNRILQSIEQRLARLESTVEGAGLSAEGDE